MNKQLFDDSNERRCEGKGSDTFWYSAFLSCCVLKLRRRGQRKWAPLLPSLKDYRRNRKQRKELALAEENELVCRSQRVPYML